MQKPYHSLEQLLGYYYYQESEFTDKQLWHDIASTIKIPSPTCLVSCLETSEMFVHRIIQFLHTLPYCNNCKKILKYVVKALDPTPEFIRAVLKPLVQRLEMGQPCISSLNLCLAALTGIFESQSPQNSKLDPHLYFYGEPEGLTITNKIKWAFEKGGTLCFWYNMSSQAKECTIFQCTNSHKFGFEIVHKNRKIYIQKVEDDTKFRLIKTTSAFLCQALYDTDVKLCLEFQIRKKFFQPFFSINVIMNNFMMNNVELDSFAHTHGQFELKLFKKFTGKFYSSLFLDNKLATQVEQFSGRKGFIQENDIRNFVCLFEEYRSNVLMLLSCVRAQTLFEEHSCTSSKETTQPTLTHPFTCKKAVRTIVQDAICDNRAIADSLVVCSTNLSTRKDISHYGGFRVFLPLLDLLEISICEDELYAKALNQFLELVKVLFQNKASSIEEASQVRFFDLLAYFLIRTRMAGFNYETISKLKEVYLALNTRRLRHQYFEKLVWGINFADYLSEANYSSYTIFIKTFFNEDIEGNLEVFGVTRILEFMRNQIDCCECCIQHMHKLSKIKRAPMQAYRSPEQWARVYRELLEVVGNILIIKKDDDNITDLICEIIGAFSYSVSPCYILSLITFLEGMFLKEFVIFKAFERCLISQNSDNNLCFFKAVSCCSSEQAKGKLIDFMFQIMGPSLFDENKKHKEMLALCIKYHSSTLTCGSSIKSQENRDSIEYSEDKLSLNSSSLHKFILINPLKSHGQLQYTDLIEEFSIIDVISQWAFSEHQNPVSFSDDTQNPGLFILMELYKDCTYELRTQIVKIIHSHLPVIKFGPELMAWAIESLMIAHYDLMKVKQLDKGSIQLCIESLLGMISVYKIQQVEEENELSIIKLVFSSVKSKYSDDIVNEAATQTYLMICLSILEDYLQTLKRHCLETEFSLLEASKIEPFDALCRKAISNAETFLKEYFVLKGDQDQFDEQLSEILQIQAQVSLNILEKIFHLLVIATAPGERKIIDEGSSERNHLVVSWLFPQREKERESLNVFYLIFIALQNSFDAFEDMNLDWRRKSLLLIKRYLVFMIELTENSGTAKLEHCEDDLKNIFLNCLSFFEHKFSTYHLYPFEHHENLGAQIEGRIRSNVSELHRTLFSVFVDLIELMQYIDFKGSMDHKSFYELMKPGRRSAHKTNIKNLYPLFWRGVDEHILEFFSLSKDKIKKEAQGKLESHLADRKLSLACSNIEKNIAKKVNVFIDCERKQSDTREKKSVNFYRMMESDKCKIYVECEEKITMFRIRVEGQQKLNDRKSKETSDKQAREVYSSLKQTWNHNRTYEGFWAHEKFYDFSQGEKFAFDNSLHKFYHKLRSKRHTENLLAPLIEIQAHPLANHFNRFINQKVYANEIFLEGIKCEDNKPEKLKIGLQFLKTKVINRLIKSVSVKEIRQIDSRPEAEPSDPNSKTLAFANVLWIKPMKVCTGFLKLERSTHRLSFCHHSNKQSQHLSLLHFELDKEDTLIKYWSIADICNFQVKRFLLKPNAVQLYFRNHKSILLAFYQNEDSNFTKFLQSLRECLNVYRREEVRTSISNSIFSGFEAQKTSTVMIGPWEEFLQVCDSEKLKESYLNTMMSKWLKYEISNLDYLMCLNLLSGRSTCDLNQYPVFPWIYSKYHETKFKKGEPKFRDFSKNVGSLGSQDRVRRFSQCYQNILEAHQHEFPVSHHFGFHYSNMPIVIYYLIRMNPYSEGARHLQGGKFDIPDRLFNSVPDTYRSSTNEVSDVKELIPEFFYLPEFLVNFQEFQFGELQPQNFEQAEPNISRKVNHVELPDGCLSAFDFVSDHREALQSPQVSMNIHKWIDLIFGYKNSGSEAEKAINTFHYLTNEQNLQLINNLSESEDRQAIESQMAFYGKTPSQIFTKPHPARPDPSCWCHPIDSWEQFTIDLPANKQQISIHDAPEIKLVDSQIVLLDYRDVPLATSSQKGTFPHDSSLEEYLIVYRNGYGFTFVLEPQELQEAKQKQLHIKIRKEFQINYQVYEGINMLDLAWHSHVGVNQQPQEPQSKGSEDQQLGWDLKTGKVPFASLNCEKIAIGGIYGGVILIYTLIDQQYQTLVRNVGTVRHLAVSNQYSLLLSCSEEGEIVKWKFEPGNPSHHVTFESKTHTCTALNQISINQHIKVILTCGANGVLGILDLDKLQVIRTIKLALPIINCLLLKYPYYFLYIECGSFHQYCYSLNGVLIEQSQLDDLRGDAWILEEFGYSQKVLKISWNSVDQTSDLLVLNMPDFSVQNRIHVCTTGRFNVQQTPLVDSSDEATNSQKIVKTSSDSQPHKWKLTIKPNQQIVISDGSSLHIWEHPSSRQPNHERGEEGVCSMTRIGNFFYG